MQKNQQKEISSAQNCTQTSQERIAEKTQEQDAQLLALAAPENKIFDNVSYYFKTATNTPILSDEQEEYFFKTLAEYRQKFQDCAFSNQEIATEFRQEAQHNFKCGRKSNFEEVILRDFKYVSLLKKIADKKISKEQKIELDTNYETYKLVREHILKSNTKLVVYLAKKYALSQNEFAEFLDIGNLGVAKAADRFDFEKDNKFSTYATWWIRQIIRQEALKNRQIIKKPNYAYEEIRKLKMFEYDEAGNPRTFDEMYDLASKEHTLPGRDTLRDLIRPSIAKAPLSIDEICKDEGGEYSFQDGPSFEAEDKKRKKREVIAQEKQYADIFKKIIEKLSLQEAQIIEAIFGPNTAAQTNYETLEKILNVNKEKIKQIESRALIKLKKIIEKDHPELIENFKIAKNKHSPKQNLPAPEIDLENANLVANANLTPLEEKIMYLARGHNGEKPKTYKEISREINRPVSFVQSIEHRAFRKIEKTIKKNKKELTPKEHLTKKTKNQLYDLCNTIMTSYSNCYSLSRSFEITERNIERLVSKLKEHDIKIESRSNGRQSYYFISDSASEVIKKLRITL